MGIISDPASAEANSYASVAEATLILGSRPYTDAWDTLSNTPNATGWLADSTHAIGVTSITIKEGAGVWTDNNLVKFANHDQIYSLTAFTATTIDISPALVTEVPDNILVRRLTYNAREKALLWSTQTLDAQVCWQQSWPTKEGQPLDWPLSTVRDCNQEEYCTNCFPQDLKVLTAEFALSLSTRDTSVAPALSGLGIKRAKVDVIEVEADSKATISMMPDYIQDLLGCMGTYNATRSGGAHTMTLVRT